MPRIVTTVHDPVALAATCRRFGLSPPAEHSAQLDAEVFGWVVRLPGLRFPLVCDTLTGLIAYHGNRTSNRWKTKELREVLNVPPGSLAFDFERPFAGIPPQHR
jgi:hypothetical protein